MSVKLHSYILGMQYAEVPDPSPQVKYRDGINTLSPPSNRKSLRGGHIYNIVTRSMFSEPNHQKPSRRKPRCSDLQGLPSHTQLRSGHPRILNATFRYSSNLYTSLHDVRHLLKCPSHPTTLTTRFYGQRPSKLPETLQLRTLQTTNP